MRCVSVAREVIYQININGVQYFSVHGTPKRHGAMLCFLYIIILFWDQKGTWISNYLFSLIYYVNRYAVVDNQKLPAESLSTDLEFIRQWAEIEGSTFMPIKQSQLYFLENEM